MTGIPVKHLKSHASDLREIFDKHVLARHVAVFDLETCSPGDDAQATKARMDSLDMDAFPVFDRDRATGYVLRDELAAGACRDFRHDFAAVDTMPESATLLSVLQRLEWTRRIFISFEKKVVGIVTRGDLQKAPVRMLLFGLVTLLEMQLLRLVKTYYTDSSWKLALAPTRIQAAERIQAGRRTRNEAMDLIDCLQFSDKRDLVLKNTQIRTRLGIESRPRGEKLLKDAEDLRNLLAHGQDLVKGASWPELIQLSQRIEALVEKCETMAI